LDIFANLVYGSKYEEDKELRVLEYLLAPRCEVEFTNNTIYFREWVMLIMEAHFRRLI
jgi:hypothetical protein